MLRMVVSIKVSSGSSIFCSFLTRFKILMLIVGWRDCHASCDLPRDGMSGMSAMFCMAWKLGPHLDEEL